MKDGRAAAIAWSADGRTVFCPSSRPTGKVWDAATGQVLHMLTGGTGEIYDLHFSPDGARLASASTDQSVRLWEPGSGAHLLTIPYPVQVYGVRFSPDGGTLAVAPMDCSIRLLEAR